MSTDRDHLDAETVAAWIDGGLDAASLAAAEAHASNCDRCRQLLATVVKTEPQALEHPAPAHQAPAHQAPAHQAPAHQAPRHQAPGTKWVFRWWMAPIAATAAAVTLWMVVPQEQVQELATARKAEEAAPTVAARDQAAPPVAEATPPPAAPQPGRQEAGATGRFAEAKRMADVAQGERANAVAEARAESRERPELGAARAAPATPAAPLPAAAAPAEPAAKSEIDATQLRRQTGPLQVVSPDPRVRWRATANGIERSEDSGRTWFIVRLAQGEVVTAGASPSPAACWLVGRRGLVLLATDGTNFTRLPFPEPVDLTAVSSPELAVAVITAADGRTFRTENAGRNWSQQ